MTHLSRPQRVAVMMSAVVAVALATITGLSFVPGVNALSGALSPIVMGGAALIGFTAAILVVAGQRAPEVRFIEGLERRVEVEGPERIVYRDRAPEEVETGPHLPLPQEFRSWFDSGNDRMPRKGDLAEKVLDPRNGPLCYITIGSRGQTRYYRNEADGAITNGETSHQIDLTPVYRHIFESEERIEGELEFNGEKYFVRYTAEGYPRVEILLDQTPGYSIGGGNETNFDPKSVFKSLNPNGNLKDQTFCVKLRQASLLSGSSTKNVVLTSGRVEMKAAPEGYDLTKLFAWGINHQRNPDYTFGKEFTFKMGRWEATMCSPELGKLEFRSIKLT